MRFFLCNDVQLNAPNTENLDVTTYHVWLKKRLEKLELIFEKTIQQRIGCVVLTGYLFGKDAAPETMVDRFFEIVKDNAQLQVLVYAGSDEYLRLSYRKDLPENLHLFSIGKKGLFEFKDCVFSNDDNVFIKYAKLFLDSIIW